MFYKTLFAVGRNNRAVQIPNNTNLKLEANFVLFCFLFSIFEISLPTKQLGVRSLGKVGYFQLVDRCSFMKKNPKEILK